MVEIPLGQTVHEKSDSEPRAPEKYAVSVMQLQASMPELSGSIPSALETTGRARTVRDFLGENRQTLVFYHSFATRGARREHTVREKS